MIKFRQIASRLDTSLALIDLNALYIHETDNYMIAFLMASLSLYVFAKFEKGYLVSPLFLFLSLGFYQAYLCIACGGFLFMLVLDVIQGENAKFIFIRLSKMLAVGAVALLLYYLVAKFCSSIPNTCSYVPHPFNQAWHTDSLMIYVRLIILGYINFFSFFLKPCTSYQIIVAIINVLVLLSVPLLIVQIAKLRYLSRKRLFVLGVLCMCFPAALNIIFFLSQGVSHNLMKMGCVFFYFVFLVLLERYQQSALRMAKPRVLFNVIRNSLAVIIFSGFIYANQVYVFVNLIAETDNNVMTRLLSMMDQCDGYKSGHTQIILLGNLQHNDYIKMRKGARELNSTALSFNTGLTNPLVILVKMEEYYAYPIKLGNLNGIGDQTFANSMPAFPNAGCVQMHQDKLFIKLSP